jgi:hypothetical protein
MARKRSIPDAKQSKQLKYYYRRRNKAREAAHIQSKKSDIYLWLCHTISRRRYTAKQNGLPFEIDHEWLKSQPMQCAVTGQLFVVGGPQTPSFDQKVAGRGYTRENTQLICLWVNYAKSKWPEDQIRALIREAGKVV